MHMCMYSCVMHYDLIWCVYQALQWSTPLPVCLSEFCVHGRLWMANYIVSGIN